MKAGFLRDTATHGFCSSLEGHFRPCDWKLETVYCSSNLSPAVCLCAHEHPAAQIPLTHGCHRWCLDSANIIRAIR